MRGKVYPCCRDLVMVDLFGEGDERLWGLGRWKRARKLEFGYCFCVWVGMGGS